MHNSIVTEFRNCLEVGQNVQTAKVIMDRSNSIEVKTNFEQVICFGFIQIRIPIEYKN
jgi:hypothetical protein